jgi:hypothetical protein
MLKQDSSAKAPLQMSEEMHQRQQQVSAHYKPKAQIEPIERALGAVEVESSAFHGVKD